MKGGGQEAAFEVGGASAGFEERNVPKEFDAVGDFHASVKIEKVYAAAEQNMLAVIDDAGVGEGVRGGSSAEVGPGFEQVHLETGRAERRRGR